MSPEAGRRLKGIHIQEAMSAPPRRDYDALSSYQIHMFQVRLLNASLPP